MAKKPALIFFLSLLCLPILSFGQPTQTARTEFPIDNKYRNFFVWPQPDSTVTVLRIERAYRNAEPFSLFKYNQHLALIWQKPVDVPTNSQFLRGITQHQVCYLLFAGQKKDEFVLARINTGTGKQTISKHKLPENLSFRINGMTALEGYLFLTGSQNDRLVVLYLNPDSPEILKIPAIYDQFSALSEYRADTVARRLEVVLAESNGLKGRLQIKRLAPDGRLFSVNFLQHPDYNYLTGRLSSADSSSKIIAGTYSFRDLRYAQGFFTGPFLPKNEQELKYHDFTVFTHYFDYLKPGRQEKVRRQVARSRGTRKLYQLRNRMLVHRLYPFANGYLLVGEMYYPHYQNEGMSRGIFDGFEFTQAVVAAFDNQGNLRWENSWPLQNIRVLDLQENITVGLTGNVSILCYPDNEKIRYKIFKDNQLVPNDKFINISTLVPGEKILGTEPEGVANWYHNNFIAYGVQSIRGVSGHRAVFYLNKIAF